MHISENIASAVSTIDIECSLRVATIKYGKTLVGQQCVIHNFTSNCHLIYRARLKGFDQVW